ncbi:MAG TPA: type IV pili methyl-accepting chemotaxis transducer N-terminal domain-containing protein, partial [Chryseolinea sp.]|nr:type IV pili methyl-accepting chemotaxis transducer N-terminal domain-containing protein [Chryseolinea sp.]
MHLNFDSDVKLRLNRFSKLGTWYILALSAIATIAIIGQVLIQLHLKDQQSDSQVVNVAGKQRMLSQKISKTVLLLEPNQSENERLELAKELDVAVSLWKISQDGLRHGNDSLQLPGKNSEAIITLFASIQTDFDSTYQNAQAIITLLKSDPIVSYASLDPHIHGILNHEGIFLSGMERIVLQYADEAHEKVSSLSSMEYILLII